MNLGGYLLQNRPDYVPGHISDNTPPRNATQCIQAVVMRIKQHLVGLQWIGSEHKRPAVTQLEVCHLQLHLSWAYPCPVYLINVT
jgi:hypothetical protein